MKMKLALVLTLSLLTIQAYAYTPIVICGERDLVLDLGAPTRGGSQGQIVLKNDEIISYMISAGAILPSEINDKGEFIVKGHLGLDHNFIAGGTSLGDRGVSLTKRSNHEYNLEIYVNQYPKGVETLAGFAFNDCSSL